MNKNVCYELFIRPADKEAEQRFGKRTCRPNKATGILEKSLYRNGE